MAVITKNKQPGGNNQPLTQKQENLLARFEVLSTIGARMDLANRFGQQYGTDRDLYEALGYKTTIEWNDYAAHYHRQDIAKAIIDRPIRMVWKGTIKIIDAKGESKEPSSLQKQWSKLFSELKLKDKFIRLNKLTAIGEYGVLLIGLSDAHSSEDLKKPVTGEKHKVLYVKPFGQNNASIDTYDSDSGSPRYGKPLIYKLTITDATGKDSTLQVHYSRVLHVTENLLQSEVRGTPCLEPVFNRLMDLEKLTGGSAEMFWRGARPGYHLKLDEKFKITPEVEDALQDQIDEYEHHLRRMIAGVGIEDIKSLAAQVSDPGDHIDIQIQMISAVTGIPKRILTGSERGELASSQDREEWLSYVQTRREEFAEQQIVRPFVDWCMKNKILPQVEEYLVQWPDLFALGDKDKAEISKILAEALAKYASAPMAESIIPPKAFLRHVLKLDDEVIESIMESIQKEIRSEQRESVSEEEEEIIEGEEKSPVVTQRQVDVIDWKKVYEDEGADWANDLQPSQFAQRFAQRLVEENKQSVLEVGCGNGKDSLLFAVAGLSVVGIDIVPEAVKMAKQNSTRAGIIASFQEGNVEELDFSDANFDAVYSLSVLHATDMEKSLAEIARVLKPNGIAAIFIYSDVQKIDGTTTEFITVDEFIELLKDNEFDIVDFSTDQDEEFDNFGEKHSIITTEIKKK